MNDFNEMISQEKNPVAFTRWREYVKNVGLSSDLIDNIRNS